MKNCKTEKNWERFLSFIYNLSTPFCHHLGLLPTTINDFWKMVWMTKSNKIVMLGSWRENNKVKLEIWEVDVKIALKKLLIYVISENRYNTY